MDEMEKMVKYLFYWMRGDGSMDVWMNGRIDWRELLQCIQKTWFCQCMWTEFSNAGSVFVSKGAWAEFGAMSKGPKWSSESIRQLQPGQCCQQFQQSFVLWVFQVPPSCFSLKGSPIITSWPNLVQELLQAYPSKHGTGNTSCVCCIPIIGAMAVKTPGVHLGLLID